MGEQLPPSIDNINKYYSSRWGQRLAGSRGQVTSPTAASGQSSKTPDPTLDANSDRADKSTADPGVDTHAERVGKSTAEPAADTHSERTEKSTTDPAVATRPEPAETSVVDSAMDTRHASNKVKIEFGSGSITGALTLTVELGDTGLGPSDLALFKSSATAKANDWSRKFETTLLTGKLDADVIDGVTVELEASVMKVTAKEGEKPDLLSIAAKLKGDVTHWAPAPPGVKITLDGSIKVALGGKLAAQVSSLVAAQVEEELLAAEAKAAGEAIERGAKKIKALREGALKDTKRSRKAIQEIEEEVSRLKVNIHKNSNRLKEIAPKVKAASKKAHRALKAIKGKTAQAVAKVMRVAAVKHAARILAKLVPILNVVSTIMDIVETYEIIKALWNGEYGGGGDSSEKPEGEEEGGGGTGKEDGASAAGGEESERGPSVDATTADEGRESDPQGSAQGTSPDVDEKQKQEAIKQLHPSARQIVNALSIKPRSTQLRPSQTSYQQKRMPWLSLGLSERMRSNTRFASSKRSRRQRQRP